jgi:hypothetical protein
LQFAHNTCCKRPSTALCNAPLRCCN